MTGHKAWDEIYTRSIHALTSRTYPAGSTGSRRSQIMSDSPDSLLSIATLSPALVPIPVSCSQGNSSFGHARRGTRGSGLVKHQRAHNRV